MSTRLMSRVRDREWLEAERDKAMHQRILAELAFAAIQGCYYRRHPDAVTAEYHAAANPYLKAAQANAAWFGERVRILEAQLRSLGGER